MLAIVVAHERPDLQEKKEQLIIESARNRDALYTIESKILEVRLSVSFYPQLSSWHNKCFYISSHTL